MLDFTKLKTPADHGDVLVAPEPTDWIRAARANHESLARSDHPLLDSTLAHWRRRTREAMAGRGDALIFVLGHQPEFIHPGVWAKYVVASRVASAVDGVAVNLVVDNDAPKQTSLLVPVVKGPDLVRRSIPFVEHRSGFAYEQTPAPTVATLERFEAAIRDAMGERFDRSQMPLFLQAFTDEDGDWVDRAVAARRAVESRFDVRVLDRRVSRNWCSPMLIDMLARAEAFATSYNRALASYRRIHRVRGAHRPIPDLRVGDGRIEVPVWVYRTDGPRRRLFVADAGGARQFFADDTPIGMVPVRLLKCCADLEAALAELGDWRLRPRALTLTIWARLLLADLFIHGIGGAKYDRITDSIITDYYGITPPHMVCVSATLHLIRSHQPPIETAPRTVRELRHALRDLEFNPQRNLAAGSDLRELFARRADAVRRATELREQDRRNAGARRQAFDEIRGLNAAALAARPEEVSARHAALQRAVRQRRQDAIARDRAYFFGLHSRSGLEALLDALPSAQHFRI